MKLGGIPQNCPCLVYNFVLGGMERWSCMFRVKANLVLN